MNPVGVRHGASGSDYQQMSGSSQVWNSDDVTFYFGNIYPSVCVMWHAAVDTLREGLGVVVVRSDTQELLHFIHHGCRVASELMAVDDHHLHRDTDQQMQNCIFPWGGMKLQQNTIQSLLSSARVLPRCARLLVCDCVVTTWLGGKYINHLSRCVAYSPGVRQRLCRERSSAGAPLPALMTS